MITDIDASKYNLDELNSFLTANPSITTVNFSDITEIPNDVLSGTNVSKVIVSTTTSVGNAFSGVSGLTIEVTTGNHPTVYSSILGGASDVTLDLSRSGITYISGGTAINWNGLTSVKFPASLESINYEVFSNCSSLKSVDLSGCTSLESIEDSAFSNCTSLASVDLSSCTGLTTIEIRAFYGCTGLTSIDLNDCTGLEHIKEKAFYGCTSLASVDLSSCTGLTTIGVGAFYGCDILSQVTLPSHGEGLWIGSFAFAVGSGPQPLHLRIPNQKMTLSLMAFSFSNREVTVYCDPTIKEKIKAAFNEDEDIIGPSGTIEVKPLADW